MSMIWSMFDSVSHQKFCNKKWSLKRTFISIKWIWTNKTKEKLRYISTLTHTLTCCKILNQDTEYSTYLFATLDNIPIRVLKTSQNYPEHWHFLMVILHIKILYSYPVCLHPNEMGSSGGKCTERYDTRYDIPRMQCIYFYTHAQFLFARTALRRLRSNKITTWLYLISGPRLFTVRAAMCHIGKRPVSFRFGRGFGFKMYFHFEWVFFLFIICT